MLTQLKPGSILAASEVDLKAQIQTATGKQMMDDLDRRIARAMTGPYNDGRLMDAVSMRVFKAENGYALVIGEKLYVCPRLEDISAALVSTIAAWELDK
jgi:hypothetical protein